MSPSALDKLRIPSTNCRAFSAVALIWNSLPVRFHCYQRVTHLYSTSCSKRIFITVVRVVESQGRPGVIKPRQAQETFFTYPAIFPIFLLIYTKHCHLFGQIF